jgi:hypothetical protein
VPSDGEFEVETDGGGAPTGIIRTTGSQIDLGCRDRVAAAYIDGELVVDRSDPANTQVYANGDFYVRLIGGTPLKIWDGRTNFVGFSTSTGEPTNAASAVPDSVSDAIVLSIVGDGVLDLALTGEVFFDLCEGDLGGFAEWSLGGGGWGFGAASQVSLGTMSSTFKTRGRIGLQSPIGDIALVQAELELNVLDFYAAGEAGIEIPGLQDVVKLFPSPGEVDAESTTCPVCVEFLIDPVNGRFKFMPSIGYEMSVGPVTLEVDAGVSLPEFELDVPRGYFYVSGGFDAKSLSFSGTLGVDLAGQLEHEPSVEFDAVTCATEEDCLYGQACVDGECQGCAARLGSPILDRYEVSFGDEGETGDSYAVTVDVTYYACPGIGMSCPLEDRVEIGQESRSFEVVQNGRLDADDLADAMADTINADSVQNCPDICDDNRDFCARAYCPLTCRFDPRDGACEECADPHCAGLYDTCITGCADALPIEAYINDAGTVIVEADNFMTGIEVTATVNGSEVEAAEVEQGEAVNGNFMLVAGATIPLKPPVFNLGLEGQLFADVFPVSNDGDPFYIAQDGTVSFGAGFGPVGISFEVGQSSTQFGLDEQDELDYLMIAASMGMTLDDIVAGLPAGLGSIGNQQQMLLGFDASDNTLCGEARARFWGFDIPLAFSITPPYDPGTDAFDTDYGGLSAAFRINLPLQLGFASGYGAIGWNGDFEFEALTELQLMPGLTLGGGGFGISNDGAYLWGEANLPGGLGRLAARGEIDATGQFDLALDGSLNIAGFELANVTGRANNRGVELSGRLQLPAGLATVEVEGWVREDGDFYFRGFTDISIPGGTSLANAEVVISPDGVSIDAGLSIPRLTEIRVTGRVQSDGYILLRGQGSIGSDGGIRLGPVELGFERTAAGVYRIWGSGALTVAGHSIVDVAFSIGTDGAFSAHGRINLWVAWAEISVSRTASGDFEMSARASFEVCAFEHCAGGYVYVEYAGGVLAFEVGGGVSGPVVNFSFSLRVDSRGCFGISDLGTFCL